MAGTPNTQARNTYKASATTQDLRALAQSHLTEIEADLTAEASQQETIARDLQKYAKVRRKDRLKRSTSPAPSTSTPQALPKDADSTLTSKAKLRSAQDVLDRLRHDPSLNLSEYRVGYLERFEGIKEMAARSWIGESTDEDWIPQHRIRYINRVDERGVKEVVWDRDSRIDKVFGSGNRMGRDDEEEDPSEFGGVALSSVS